jgi:hypothetical protein
MADELPKNVTLADLVANGSLSNPRRYLRLALANILQAGDYGSVNVRIGRTGKGVWPHYALVDAKDGKTINRFDGQNYTPWDDASKYHDERWSDAIQTAANVHSLWRDVQNSN